MADYAKLEIKALYSKNSDHSSPKASFSPVDYTLRPDEYFHCEVQAAIATDSPAHTTIDTSILASATLLAIKNNDSNNYVTATFDCAGMSSTDTSVRIHAGGIFVTTDFTVAEKLKLVANSAVCQCEIFIVGT
tara:strand:- start:286 stop:684 length:399 start_codon:yes stop_codon:yes gene_type:complete